MQRWRSEETDDLHGFFVLNNTARFADAPPLGGRHAGSRLEKTCITDSVSS